MPFLRILRIFGFNVGAAVVAIAIYPILATATKPLVKWLTKKKAGPKGEKQQTNTKSKEKLVGSAARAKRQPKLVKKTKPLVKSLTKKKAGPKGEKQQTNTKSKEKLVGLAAGAKRQPELEKKFNNYVI